MCLRRIGDVSIVAYQPIPLAECLDINSSRKAARFERLYDKFNNTIHIDVPIFLPGRNQ